MKSAPKYFVVLLFVIGIVFLTSCSNTTNDKQTDDKEYSAYLMAYFYDTKEKLCYAYSYDARNWILLNNNNPVFDAKVRLRDPYISRVKGQFHMVHTMGWDNPVIYHWVSSDLINWKGGPITVVDNSRKRAWAPEFFYSADEELFYVHWASIYNGHNTIHYITTKDWSDITPENSAVYFDIGIHDIDLTIVKYNGIYYGFHKPGAVEDSLGIRILKTRTLKPGEDGFGFGKDGSGKEILLNQLKPIEAPEVIKLIGQQKWYIYADPFHYPMQAWETSDFSKFTKIDVNTPKDAKHCSMIPITQKELDKLLAKYPNTISTK